MAIWGVAATHSAALGPSTGSPPASSADPKGCVHFLLLRAEIIPSYLCAKKLVLSVADPDPSDPYVFGPPGSGSISQRYGSGSGSGSFYHQGKL